MFIVIYFFFFFNLEKKNKPGLAFNELKNAGSTQKPVIIMDLLFLNSKKWH